MSASTQLLPSQYVHLVTPNLTLGPASGDAGEFVPLPLCILAPVAVVELLMLQTLFPSPTLFRPGQARARLGRLPDRRAVLHQSRRRRLATLEAAATERKAWRALWAPGCCPAATAYTPGRSKTRLQPRRARAAQGQRYKKNTTEIRSRRMP